jgi:DNA replication protein DnaC
MARLDGRICKSLDKLTQTDLLILDDFGLTQLEQQQRYDLLELIEERHSKKSTIISSQLPVANWYHVIGDETIADAILDRLIHTSHRVELKGESMRRKKL